MNNIVKTIVNTIVSLSNNGTTTIGFESLTEPSMNKTNNPFFGKVLKVSSVGGMIGYDYENSVNNQLGREGKEKTFVSQPRKWGVRDENHPFLVRHTKKGETVERFYLSVKVQQSNKKPIYLDKETLEVIPTEKLRPYLKESKKPNTQEDLDKEIIIRDYEISTLRKMSIGGQKLILQPDVVSDVKVFRVKHPTVSTKQTLTKIVNILTSQRTAVVN